MKSNKTLLLCLLLGACSSPNVENLSPSIAYEKGMKAFKKNDLKTAAMYFERAHASDEYRVKEAQIEIQTLWTLKEYKKYTEVVEAHLEGNGMFDLELRQNLGLAYVRIGDDVNAFKTFTQIMVLAPTSYMAHYHLARIHNINNRTDEALTLVNKLLTITPKDNEALILRAEIYANSKKYPQAIEDYKTVLATDRNNHEAYNGLVGVYKITDMNKAFDYSNLWVAADLMKPAAYEVKADILVKLNRKNEAIAVYKDMVSKFPTVNAYRSKLADLLIEAKDFVTAKEHIDYVLKTDIWDSQANYLLGRYHVDQEQFVQAGRLFKKLYEHDPSQEWVVVSYAKFLEYIKEGKTSQKVISSFNSKKADESKMAGVVATPSREVASAEPGFTMVQVAKGDSLQSLSRTHYGTNRQWKKIYDANKDVIPNAKSLVIGTTLKIPQN